jgi:hypothetical protein
MITWEKERSIEEINQKLITLCILAIRHRSAVADKVINYREEILQKIREFENDQK